MPIERVFLEGDRPALSLAVDYLCERFGAGASLDLGEVIVAVPGGRAGRRLLERLVDVAETGRRTLCPPRIITIGRLPELLYTPKRPFADALTEQLAWVDALRRSPAERLGRLVARPPDDEDLPGWLALGEMFGRLHRELASEAMDFEAVVDCGRRMKGFQEKQRWTALSALQRDYLATLDRLGLWDIQTARLFAVREGECHTDRSIVLVGTVDLNRLQRMMLEGVAERVSALVVAPRSMADRFDALGCLHSEAWQELPVALRDEQIEVVPAPADQAAAAVRAIAALRGRFAADEITVGVPDGRIVPYLLQQFEQAGLRARHGVGEPLGRMGPYQFLSAVADYLGQARFSSFAVLVRHPDLGRWLESRGARGDWLSELDHYQAEHLPYELVAGPRLRGHAQEHAHASESMPPDGTAGQASSGTQQRTDGLWAVFEAVEDLLRPLEGSPRPLAAWGPAVVDLLVAVYGGRPLDPDDPADRAILAACEKIRATLEEHRAIHEELMPRVAGAEAIRLALRALLGETVPVPADGRAIELLGWLELPLDDAPVLIATGMNEGIVPTSLGADLFLPNQMRRALGIEDNLRRLARDTYALTALAASGRQVKLIAGRRSPEGDPLVPSRLLLVADPETTARRVRRLFRAEQSPGATTVLPGRLRPGRAESEFTVPEPGESGGPIESMRVTEFRDYLACPYRYYLRHRLKLEGLSDRAEELDARAFGSLAHEVLGKFGVGPVADSIDAEQIAAFLDAALARELKRVHGDHPLSSIRVQAEQLRLRLRHFARWQARRAAAGWRIEYVEQGPPSERAALDVDGRPMGLRGRIDRIDVNVASGERIVLDYKTGDTVKTPEQTHRKEKSQWVDLQLPLYRRLARALGIEGPVALGYVALPKDVGRVGLLEAAWTDEELEEAEETARRVVRRIRSGEFWPPAVPPPAFSEEYAAICQDGQFGAVLFGEDGGEDEEDAG